MLVISNGVNTFKVTKGAYRTIYMHQGYHIVSEAGASAPATDGDSPMKGTHEETRDGGEVDTTLPEPESGSAHTSGSENDGAEDEEDLSEIPLSEMSVSQLKMYAEHIGVKLDGTETKKELRQLIVENMD